MENYDVSATISHISFSYLGLQTTIVFVVHSSVKKIAALRCFLLCVVASQKLSGEEVFLSPYRYASVL